MGLRGLLADMIAKVLSDEGRYSRRSVHVRSRKEREANRARQKRRAVRAITRARRPQ